MCNCVNKERTTSPFLSFTFCFKITPKMEEKLRRSVKLMVTNETRTSGWISTSFPVDCPLHWTKQQKKKIILTKD